MRVRTCPRLTVCGGCRPSRGELIDNRFAIREPPVANTILVVVISFMRFEASATAVPEYFDVEYTGMIVAEFKNGNADEGYRQ